MTTDQLCWPMMRVLGPQTLFALRLFALTSPVVFPIPQSKVEFDGGGCGQPGTSFSSPDQGILSPLVGGRSVASCHNAQDQGGYPFLRPLPASCHLIPSPNSSPNLREPQAMGLFLSCAVCDLAPRNVPCPHLHKLFRDPTSFCGSPD